MHSLVCWSLQDHVILIKYHHRPLLEGFHRDDATLRQMLNTTSGEHVHILIDLLRVPADSPNPLEYLESLAHPRVRSVVLYGGAEQVLNLDDWYNPRVHVARDEDAALRLLDQLDDALSYDMA